MSNVVLFMHEGSLQMLIPAENSNLSLQEIINKDIPEGCEHRIVDSSEIPLDRTFRDAWDLSLNVDMVKAREIWARKIRVERDRRLKELDVDWLRSFERGDDAEAGYVAVEKQKLRDLPVTANLERFDNVDSLSNYWPEILGG